MHCSVLDIRIVQQGTLRRTCFGQTPRVDSFRVASIPARLDESD